MFEQSLYEIESETPAMPSAEGDLFHDYEIRSWELTPRILQILGVSSVSVILMVVVAAQASFLTMKGCDSPLVGRFCDALDMVVVGTKLFGTEREYVDAVYDKTSLSDDEEVVFVDVSGEVPPISYPEGYFQIANPVQYQELLAAANSTDSNSSIPGVPNFPNIPSYSPPPMGRSLNDLPFNPPRANNDVIDGELPSGFGNDSTRTPSRTPAPVNRRPTRPRPSNSGIAQNPRPTPEPTPEATPMAPEDVTALEINRRPLTDFADDVAAKWSAKEIDLNQEFMVVMNGVITKEGKLDRQKSKFDVSKQRGDPRMVDVAKSAIEAIGDTGFLVYLQSLGIEKINVQLFQDQEKVVAILTAPQKTAERAETIRSGLNSYITIGKISTKNPSDERLLLDAATLMAEGKDFRLNFVLPKAVAQELINRKLQEAQARKNQTPQPNSGAPPPSDIDAGK